MHPSTKRFLARGRRWEYIKPEPLPDCILWEGATTDKGYGQKRIEGKVVYVHRHAWEEVHGPIPKGMTIDHVKCRIKICMNPDHMEVVTRQENGKRATDRSLYRVFTVTGVE